MPVPTETNQTETMNAPAFGGTEHFDDMSDEVDAVEEHPEPSTETTEEVVEQPTEAEVETEEAAPEEAEEVEGEQAEETPEEEAGDEWLPDEQAKQFPLETLIEFSNRRKSGFTEEEIRSDKRVQNLLRDKLNTDIYAAQLERQRQSEETETEEETNPFAEEIAEVEQKAQPTQPTTAATDPQAQHYARVDQYVAAIPKENLQKWGEQILKKYGANTDVPALTRMLADPKLTSQQRSDVTAAIQLAQGAGELAAVQARGVFDLVLTALPQMLPDFLEQLYPGTAERARDMRERAECNEAWEAVRTNPAYAKLPAYGTPEFKSAMLKAEKALGYPEGALGNMQFFNSKGQPLPYRQNVEIAFRAVAKAAVGQKQAVPAKVIQIAQETGRKQAEKASQKRAAGRAMGSGTSSRGFTEKTGDPQRDILREVIAEDEAESAPFSHPKWKS